jgi:NifU-like protein
MARVQRAGAETSEETPDGTALESRAKQVVADVLRPLIAADGGDIELVSVSPTLIVVRLSGTCAGCPGRPYTVSGVIERAMRKAVSPDIRVEVAPD